MKMMLIIALIITMLATPTVICAPAAQPAAPANAAPAGQLGAMPALPPGSPALSDGPGFSEAGRLVSAVGQLGAGGVLQGLSNLAPGAQPA
jgi:hypothetical protein